MLDTPVMSAVEHPPVPQEERQAENFAVTLNFKAADMERLRALACLPRNANVVDVLIHALNLYEELAKQAHNGFKQLRLRNSSGQVIEASQDWWRVPTD